MNQWSIVFGVVTGLVVAVGGFAAIVALICALFRWATEFVRPTISTLEDEDEIDHRFY